MSAVDPKPTYTLKTEIYLVSLGLSCRVPAVRDKLLALAGMPMGVTERLDIMDKIHAGHLVDDLENDLEDGKEISLMEMLVGRKEDQIREGLDNQGVQSIASAFIEWSSGYERVYVGSRAAFILMEDVVIAESKRHVDMKDTFSRAADLAAGLTHASACALKMHPEATEAVLTNMFRTFVLKCGSVVNDREVAEDISFHTVSRRVRRAYSFAMTRRTFKAKDAVYPDGVRTDAVKTRLSGAIRRDEDEASSIEYFFLGPIRAIKRRGVLYIIDQDNIRKVYHTFHRRMMAVFSAQMSEISSAHSYNVDTVKTFCDTLITAASNLAKQNKPISYAARGLHQIWCAEFAAAYDTETEEYWRPHYDEIIRSAIDMTPMARRWVALANTIPAAHRLELLRLHHIMPAPDTPASLLADLTWSIPSKARKPERNFWVDFMNFVKTYELCMYLFKRRHWPRVNGDEAAKNDKAYKRCLTGKFSMPDKRDFGRLWIANHFQYIHYADQLAIKAKDATRVIRSHEELIGVRGGQESFEHNELLHALKKGSSMGRPTNWTVAEARAAFWDKNRHDHVLADTAAKAEATKSDCKPRGTFSANGEFRHFQGEFDRNCQVVNDIIGCGSLRADMTKHAKGMASIIRGTGLRRMTTSHDIEGWSPSQDRECFREFGCYRANMFRGLDGDGWAERWKCFDIYVNKPGIAKMMHQTNGGYQGFPGTMDTSLHVLILTFFLWRMREKGKIPHDVITLAKATIDDCLAQIEVWNGDEANLEMEIRAHYSRLGYTIDSVKSIISKSKAIYLNQAAIRGAIVQQGLKIMCKADRPQEVILSTPFEDFMACTAGAKAAITNGHDVLSAYYCAATLGTHYLIKAADRLGTLDRDEFVIAALLPRGDGGLGLPTMVDLLCKEHPDSRAHANYIINQYAMSRHMVHKKLSDRALAMWAGLKSTPWGIVSKHSIFFRPRGAVRSGIHTPELVRRNMIIRNARNWVEANPYKHILETSKSETIMSIYGRFLTSDINGIDAVFLETYAAHLPECIIDAMIGKVTSYRVAKEICGAADIVVAQVKMANMFRTMVDNIITARHTCTLPLHEVDHQMRNMTGYKRAQLEREEFYTINDVRINHHTVPSPLEALAIVRVDGAMEECSGISPDYSSLKRWATDIPVCARNAVSKHGVGYPFKSTNWVAESAETFQQLDKISATFVEGCAILQWAELAGMSIRAWEEVFMMRWVGDLSVRSSKFVTQSLQGSIKRSTTAFGDRYHPVFCYPNLQRSVMVNITHVNSLMTGGKYDMDPMSMIAGAYTIGVVNMSFIMDQFVMCGKEPPGWSWELSINAELYEEQRHTDIAVSFDPKIIGVQFEMALEGTDFLSNDGGVANQLREIVDYGSVEIVLAYDVADEENPYLEFGRVHAPMLAMPVEAPPGAAFLALDSRKRTVGTLVIDQIENNKKLRILEVSPNSHKLCAIAAMQHAEISTAALNARSMGDTDAISDADLSTHFARIARHTIKLIKEHLPTNYPLLKAAEAIRACGISEFRWDSNDQEDVQTFEGEARRICRSYPNSVMKALTSYRPEVMSSTTWSFESSPVTIEQVKDPEKANVAKRVSEITRKYRARAKEYEQRIQFLKSVGGGITRDRLSTHREKKIVYLTAARTVMGCAHFDKGPILNHEVTAERLLSKINDKIRSKGDTPAITDHLDLLTDGEIDEKRVVEANYRRANFGWYPREYARGVDAVLNWVLDDCAHEKRLVYFVPRYVEVKTKVRTHRVQQDVLSSDFHHRIHVAAEVAPFAGREQTASVVGADAGGQVDDAEPAVMSVRDLFKKKSEEKKKDKGRKREVVRFVRRLEAWQLLKILEDNNHADELEGEDDDMLAVQCNPNIVRREHLTEDFLTLMENLVFRLIMRRSLPLVEPEAFDLEANENIVE